MDYKELAQKVRAKHPSSYDDMDDLQLAKAIVAKYPQYSDVTFDAQPEMMEKPSLIDSLAKSAGRFVGGMFGGLPGQVAGEKLAENPQAVGSVLSAPFRGFRGLGVGAQRLFEGDDPAQVLNRASAAVQPGYAPREGEKLGTFFGTAAPLAPLGVLPGAGAAAVQAGAESLADRRPIIEAGANALGTGAATLATAGAIKGTGYGLGKGLEYGGKIAKSGYRAFISHIKGTGRQVTDRVFDSVTEDTPLLKEASQSFFGAIGELKKNAAGKLRDAMDMPVSGSTAQEIADKGLVLAKTLRERSSQLAEEASQKLSTEPTISRDELLAPIKELQESLKTKGQIFGQARAEAFAALQRFSTRIKKITEGKPGPNLVDQYGKALPGGPAQPISEVELKDILRAIDGDTIWDGPASEPIIKVLRQFRNSYDSILRRNTEYNKALEPVGKMIKAAEDVEDSLALERGRGKDISPTDQTLNRVKSILTGKRSESEKSLGGVGLRGILESGKKRLEQGTAKEAAVKEAQKAMNVKYPTDVNVYQMAETAARQGKGSPAYVRLERTLQSVLGPEEGSELAESLINSGAKEIFLRGKGSTFVGGSLQGLAGASAGEASLQKLLAVDEFLRSGISTGQAISRVTEKIPTKGLSAIIAGYRESQKKAKK